MANIINTMNYSGGGNPIEVFKWSDGRNPGSTTFTSPEFTISTPKFMYFACSAKQAYENTLRLQGYNGSTWVNVASAPKKVWGNGADGGGYVTEYTMVGVLDNTYEKYRYYMTASSVYATYIECFAYEI